MRQILFHIPLDTSLSLGPLGNVPVFGFGLVLLLWVLLAAWWGVVRMRTPDSKYSSDDGWIGGQWIGVALAIIKAPALGAYLREHGSEAFRDGLPIFGYGFMLFVAVGVGTWVASLRANKEGLSSDRIWDLAFVLFLSGISGARMFYLVQYRDRVFQDVHTIPQFLFTVFNLSSGGIVLYGGLIAAAVGFFSFCAVNRIRPLALLDIITPSIFIGIGFGRIGCFLNGCCYGDECSLPWAVRFPRGSATFSALVEKKLLDPEALWTPPLHPTQLYSALDGFILAAITAWYFSRRRRNGEVFAIGVTMYPITRFLIEFIRGDESGIVGLTISQWISVCIFVVAICYMYYLSRRPAIREPIGGIPEPTLPTGTVPAR